MATNDLSRQVYWLEGAGLVTNSSADLSNPHALTVPTANGILNLAIDPAADIVLWTGYSPPSIRRARLSDGTSLGSISLTSGQTPDDIAVDPTSRKVYWTDIYGGITRANYDGTSQEPLVPAGALGTGSAGIALDLSAGKMYLSYPNSDTITRRNLGGTGVETVLSLGATEHPIGLELYAGRMYWCDNDNGRLRSATTGGADAKTVLSGLDSPRAVSVLALAGDFNRDGIVDAADYTVWRDGLGTVYTQADYTVWKTNFGACRKRRGAMAAVPEPDSVLLLCVGSASTLAFMRYQSADRNHRFPQRWLVLRFCCGISGA